jgi:type IV pilus assembly protein PilQ
MIVFNRETPIWGAAVRRAWWKWAAICAMAVCGAAFAQDNAIESITAHQQGANVIVKIKLKNALATPPLDFKITNPARIVLDFPGAGNDTGRATQEIGLGDVRSANVVQAGDRSRVVFNMVRALNYATALEGDTVILTVDGSGGVATAVNSAGLPVAKPAGQASDGGKQMLRNIDFRRGVGGEGRIVVDLPGQIAVDAKQQGQSIIVNFLHAGVPAVLHRRLDVTDFGTPVQTVTTAPDGDNVRMVIEPKGLWEHSIYQSDSQLVIEVRPLKEDPNKLTQGTQGYRGEKISFNFQDIDVRAILGIIADVSNLNILTSDSVSGKLTIRVKDVPWDQALDIVMQAKGLDMRKNGTVIWIAPKDELLTKEKLELEQKAQIAELEPLKTETFQLNYQKAESFKQVFGLDAGAGTQSKNRILSPRGSAQIDPRTNQLFITDVASKLEEVRSLVQKTDIPSRQVQIEARIVEANDSFSRNLGAQLGVNDLRYARGGTAGYQVAGQNSVLVTGTMQGVQTQTGQITPAATNGAVDPSSQFVNLPAASINGFNPTSVGVSLFSAASNRFLNLELSALEADGKGKVISSPRVVTADQLKALIEQGTEIPYNSATSSGATSVSFEKANLSLEVTPQITPDGNIILDVDVKNDSVGIATSAGLAINTKHVKTQVLVENGGTVVLGGIFTQDVEDSVTKTPWLGDIPILGNLFKTTSKSDTRTELLVFITPKIVTDKLTTR